ncbi:hypothetical protein [Ectothiorhodospira shaposhnikovii]|uniref:hypothetical protein n=1 Tax=Ectothiorhodospira shaposhnikovii TaxID=1054 RepID=UPI001EE8511B|nr:hypothetical protein [Ectothiorhodospira shaposhnikovii]MCG5512846.1 hypothetical protein [Ectothiorhodospira shaposhnikovii]
MILTETADILVERPETFSGAFPLLSGMYVERGTNDDWKALQELHYKGEGRVLGRVYRCMLDGQLVGVAMMSSPRLLLSGRHDVFPKLRNGQDTHLVNVHRAKFVNRHFVLNSRIVVDTMFRAAGVSYRFLNLVARMEGKSFVEIQSSMSRFNPFAIRAGFQFAKPKHSNAYEKGLTLITRHFDSHPADALGILAEIEAMPEAYRERVLDELRLFYLKNSAREQTGTNLHGPNLERIKTYSNTRLIKSLVQLVFSTPMYGVYRNPDAGKALPERLPLLAFDNQKPSEPLDLQRIKA